MNFIIFIQPAPASQPRPATIYKIVLQNCFAKLFLRAKTIFQQFYKNSFPGQTIFQKKTILQKPQNSS